MRSGFVSSKISVMQLLFFDNFEFKVAAMSRRDSFRRNRRKRRIFWR